MSTFNDLPDELFVKILCSLDDYDPTKVRLERVSRRFYSCLRESWKYNTLLLNISLFLSIEESAAFLERMPEITHLLLLGPERYVPEQVQILYRNVHKMRVSKLEYDSRDLSRCSSNSHLFIWCLTNSVKYLKNLDFRCCEGYTPYHDPNEDTTCRTFEAFVRLLPTCRKIEEVHLRQIYWRGDSLFKALGKLTLRSLSLTDLSSSMLQKLDIEGLAQLLNSITSLESLSIRADDRAYGADSDLGKFVLKDDAGLQLQSLTIDILNFDYMQQIPIILKFLPKLRNFTVKFDRCWLEDEAEQDDPKLLMEVITEVINTGKSRDFAICFDLTISRYRYEEYSFGEDLMKRLLALTGARTKRNRDSCKWEVQIQSENVKVRVRASITDCYAERKKREEEAMKRKMNEWFVKNGIL